MSREFQTMNGTWWNMDVTHDITGTAEGKELYGFRKLDGAFGPDEDFYIIKIYCIILDYYTPLGV